MTKSERINVRLSKEDKDIIETAAKKAHMNISQYLIASALNGGSPVSEKEAEDTVGSVAICSKEIMNFFHSAENYVLECSDDLEIVRRLYLTTIKHDTEEASAFIKKLPSIRKQLKEDLDFFIDSDPAIDSKEEVVLAYPGFKAIRYYRIAHELYLLNEKLYARIISEEAHVKTGVDIHPGATIASPFFIDHGTGIVVGETTIIGKRVKIYQCVTLGALSLAKGSRLKGEKRHPTIGDDVTIYAGVSILGGNVSIGNKVTIGSNVFLTKSIPDNMRVTIGEPELVLQKK